MTKQNEPGEAEYIIYSNLLALTLLFKEKDLH